MVLGKSVITTEIESTKTSTTFKRARLGILIAQFIAMWLLFVGLLAGTAFLLNIDWARPKLQEVMSEALKRQVKLGQLSWSLGLNGLSLSTSKISLTALSGEPFANAGPSEIGLAFLPLIKGHLIIHYLTLTQPEVWAFRLPGGKWNFSDLLDSTLQIRFVQVEKGKLHVFPQLPSTKGTPTSPLFQNHPLPNVHDFSDINMKLVWPHKHRRWPLYLSLSLPKKSYTSYLKVTALGNGNLANWQDNHYQLDVRAENLNPDDFESLRHLFPQVRGLVSINFSGQGKLSKLFKAKLETAITNPTVQDNGSPLFAAKEARASCELSATKEKLKWSNLTGNIDSLTLSSQGEVLNWQSKCPSYGAWLLGNVADLSKVETFALKPVKIAFLQKNDLLSKASQFFQPGHKLSGTAEVRLNLQSINNQAKVEAHIKAQEVPIQGLMQIDNKMDSPFLSLLGITSKSKLSGQITLCTDHGIELKEAKVVAGDTSFVFNGFIDEVKKQFKLHFAANNIELAHAKEQFSSCPKLVSIIHKHVNLSHDNDLALSGKIDLVGETTSSKDNHDLKLTANLNRVTISDRSSSVKAEKINGQMHFDDKNIQFDHITGSMDGGQFALDGSINSSNQRLSVKLQATKIDLSHIGKVLRAFNVDLPILAQRQLYGRVREFSLNITGQPEKPQITLFALPEDLYYQPPGLSKPLRAVSGKITYNQDELTLKDVGLVSQGNKLITNLVIANLSHASKLKHLRVQSAGIELKDVHFYLSSALMPPPLRKGYLDFIAHNHIVAAHGKAYGDMLFQAKQGDFDFDGVIGFYNVGGRFGLAGYPVEKLSGILAASGKELIIQEVSGTIGKSTFVVDGHVTEYRSAKATWQIELRSQVYPFEFLQLVPGLAGESNIKVSANMPIFARATVNGNQESTAVIFSSRADANASLRLTSPIGSIYQPAGQSITLDGSLTYTPGNLSTIEIHNSHLLVGDSTLQGQGEYTWSYAKPGYSPTLSFQLNSPNPIPAKTLAAVLDPTININEVEGKVQGKLIAQGQIEQLTASGNIDFHKLTLPMFNLYNVSGSLVSKGFVLPNTSSTVASQIQSTSKSNAHLELTSATIGNLDAHDVIADIDFEPQTTNSNSARIILKNGKALLAHGELTLSGWLSQSDRHLHLDTKLTKVSAQELLAGLMGHPGELSGLADLNIILDGQGQDYKEFLRNLNGYGTITVSGGKVSKFAPLQEKLTQANLLQQGLFGFNLNNLLQSMLPVKTGEFKHFKARFQIATGLLSLEELKFHGDDMHLRAQGMVNLPLNTINLDVAGNVPRVSSSLIGGPVGQVSRELTIQKFLHIVTLHKLENFPSLPLLGDIASDRPRAFTFKVTAPLDQPRAVAHSIEKTFHWLPDHPNASAHPLPSMH